MERVQLVAAIIRPGQREGRHWSENALVKGPRTGPCAQPLHQPSAQIIQHRATIREDRDAAFWTKIASHPEVAKTLYGQPPEMVGEKAGLPNVRHFASEHGGWLLIGLEPLGIVWDLHAMFTPEGWGREANAVLKHTLRSMFETAQVLIVNETDCPRSRPPVSFGFRPAGGETQTLVGPLKSWVLTRAAWEASPAYRRA